MKIRLAEEKDMVELWDWRNDPNTRRNSINKERISFETHKTWFIDALNNERKTILIGIDQVTEQKIGMVRFDVLKDKRVETSININPKLRGGGFGSRLLQKSVDEYFRLHPGSKLVANIVKKNEVSVKLFSNVGFEYEGDVIGSIIRMSLNKVIL